MHPFSQLFRSIPSLDPEHRDALLGPPEDALPLLADEELHHLVADALHLQLPHAEDPWVHKVGGLFGLYTQKEPIYNPEWKIPKFPQIHLREDIIPFLSSLTGPLTINEKRRLKLILPARFFPNHTKYLPLRKGIKDYYPNHKIHHFITTAKYLLTLWESGITYLRLSERSASFYGQPYSWEQKLLLPSHGVKLVNPKSSGFSPGAATSQSICSPGSGLGPKQDKRSLASGKESFSRSLGTRLCPSSRGPSGVVGNSHSRPSEFGSWGPVGRVYRSRDRSCSKGSRPRWHCATTTLANEFKGYSNRKTKPNKAGPESTPSYNQSEKGASSNTKYTTRTGYSSTKHDLEREVRTPCYFLAHRDSCGSTYCLSQLVNRESDWGPCIQHGSHVIRTPRTPSRVTGGVFLVDKNPNNRSESRLVVDFSQFSRGDTRVQWPRFAVPNLQALTNLLSTHLWWVSLDVSAAFYHIPLAPGSMPHLLVGSPGLQGLDPGLSLPRSRCHHHQSTMQSVHSLCRRDILLALMLLYKTHGRKLHLLSHPFVMGFRKIPMGVGLSPFLLAQFTAALASVVRRNFPHIMAFAYMDDVVLGAKSPEHLDAVHTAVVTLFKSLGIHINPDKTKHWGHDLHFMGLSISSQGAMPQDKHKVKGLTLIKSLPCHKPLDWKILQRITGLLGFLAPFTDCGYPALMPLYNAITKKTAFTFSAPYKNWLMYLYSNFTPVRRQRPAVCKVFADATPSTIGIVNYYSNSTVAAKLPTDLPIHVAELIAACIARCLSGSRLIGTDNTIVLSKKFTHFPWLLGCTAHWILRGTSFCYVPSELNPADAPSRGLLGFRCWPPPLRFLPSTGRTSLWAESPPVQPHHADRVRFTSPLRTSADAWQPP
ncbi:polymerase [Orthohepadnavirus magnimyotis]|nr:polymerase [Longquan Myotis chinensis orthohepadnavirus 1]